ncbi:MAG: LysE family translocator [Litoreibacter sp.]|uniref:LysE family translocator n=1 Tax=Litoreibacter sp. TaxID=1969459 RepID=UPI003297A2A1
MTYDLLTALILFAFVSSATPGPNNLMLMASGANFGFRRSVPHMLGISIGFCLMIFLVGIGLIQVFDLYPVSHLILKVASISYMSWLAWKIANAAAPKDGKADGTPMTFTQAAAFQWVNPKAWAMALTAITLYAPDRSMFAVAMVALVFGLVNAPSVSIWTVLGQQLRRLLTNNSRLRIFNFTMAALLIASLYPLVVQA